MTGSKDRAKFIEVEHDERHLQRQTSPNNRVYSPNKLHLTVHSPAKGHKMVPKLPSLAVGEEAAMAALRGAVKMEMDELLSVKGRFRELLREELCNILDARPNLRRSTMRPPSPVKDYPKDSPATDGQQVGESPPEGSSDPTSQTTATKDPGQPTPRRRDSVRSSERSLERSMTMSSMSDASEAEEQTQEETKAHLSHIVNAMSRNEGELPESLTGGVKRATWAQRLDEIFERIATSVQEPPRTSLLARFTTSKFFETVVCLVIFVNCAFMAYTADYEVANPEGMNDFIVGGEWIFQIFYSVELFIKLCVHRQYFFCNGSWKANWFDAFLVAVGWLGQLQTDGGGVSASFLRVVRLAKLGRTMRAVRVMSELKHLRAFLICLQGSFMSFFWSLVVLLVVLIIFSLFMVQILAGHVANGSAVSDNLEQMYGTTAASIVTLFRAATGGDDWGLQYEVISETGPMGSVVFLVFIAFTQLALINIITGIFVEAAMQTLRPDKEAIVMEQTRIEKEHIQELERMCNNFDTDGNGKISRQEFEIGLSRGRIPRLLMLLGLSKHHVVEFFSAMEEDGEVDISTFVRGCMQLKGAATNFDVQMVHAELRSIWNRQEKYMVDMGRQIGDVQDQQGEVVDLLEAHAGAAAASPRAHDGSLQI